MQVFKVLFTVAATNVVSGYSFRRAVQEECNPIADLMFLFDKSTSIASNPVNKNYKLMKTFATSVMGEFNISQAETNFGIAEFHSDTIITTGFDTVISYNKTYLTTTINGLQYTEEDADRQGSGTTKTGKAIDTIYKQVFSSTKRLRPTAPKFIALITDGESNDDAEFKVQTVVANLRKTDPDFHIISIGINLQNSGKAELRAISDKDENNNPLVFLVDDFVGLEDYVEKFSKLVCKVRTDCVSEDDCTECDCDTKTQTCTPKMISPPVNGGAGCDLTPHTQTCTCGSDPSTTVTSSAGAGSTDPAKVATTDNGNNNETNLGAIIGGSLAAAAVVVAAAGVAGYYYYQQPSAEAGSSSSQAPLENSDASPLFENPNTVTTNAMPA
eukprot:Pgem_evm1s2526